MNADVKQYIKNLPRQRQEFLLSVRKLILGTIPEIKEKFQYNMPCYEYKDKTVCSVASQKHYVSFYMFDKNVLENHSELVEKLDTGKCCIRFKKLDDKNSSLEIIKKLLLITCKKDRN